MWKKRGKDINNPGGNVHKCHVGVETQKHPSKVINNKAGLPTCYSRCINRLLTFYPPTYCLDRAIKSMYPQNFSPLLLLLLVNNTSSY